MVCARSATREMERTPGSGFHPLIVIVDEAQAAFMCPAKGEDKRPYGGSKATSRYFMAARKLHNQGRAVNVLLWEGTQDPTDQNLPKLVREGAHIRASLALGTESQSRMALGDMCRRQIPRWKESCRIGDQSLRDHGMEGCILRGHPRRGACRMRFRAASRRSRGVIAAGGKRDFRRTSISDISAMRR